LYVTILHVFASTSPAYISILPNNNANWRNNGFYSSTTTFTSFANNASALGIQDQPTQIRQISNNSGADLRTNWVFWLWNYSDPYSHKMHQLQKSGYDATNGQNIAFVEGASSSGISTSDITSLVVSTSAGTFSAGEVKIWGLR
jgi:hypothetical protein